MPLTEYYEPPVRMERHSNRCFELSKAGEGEDGYSLWELRLEGEQVMFLQWPDDDAAEVWEHVVVPWILYWQLHSGG